MEETDKKPLLNRVLFWTALLTLTLAFFSVLYLIHLPAAALIASIFAGVALSIYSNTEVKISKPSFFVAQSILGCMIGQIFTVSMLLSIAANWELVLFSSFSMLACSFAIGWVLTVKRVFPGSTAIWGSWPGAATAMVILSESYGADTRLVAFMQYTRVVVIAILASLVGMYFGVSHTESLSFNDYFFPAFNAWNFLTTLLLACGCAVLARVTNFSPGPLLIAMFFSALLGNIGLVKVDLPQWILFISYLIIGWNIGLRFTRSIVIYAMRTLHLVLFSILLLLILCVGIAFIMVKAGSDPLTAYLAASPGGADAIAIIAASIDVDMAFIMSVQWSRFLLILLIGPYAARFAGNYFKKRNM